MCIYRRIRSLAALLATLLLACVSVYAQQTDPYATLFMNPTPSAYPSDWQSDPSIGTLSIFNPNPARPLPPTVVVELRIYRETAHRQIIFGRSRPLPVNAPPQFTVMNNTQFLSLKDLQYDPSLQDVAAKTGRLPEGQYRASVTITDGFSTTLIRETLSDFFTIAYPDAPYLLGPTDADTLAMPYPVFQWVESIAPRQFMVHYSLRVVEVLSGQTPSTALNSNGVAQYENANIVGGALQLPIDAFPLRKGARYAWRVQALDQNDYPATTNNGYSQIFSFTYGDRVQPDPRPRPLEACFTVAAVSPENAGKWKTLTIPSFSARTTPGIERSGLRSVGLRVWESGRSGADSNLTSGTPLVSAVLDTLAAGLTITPEGSTTLIAVKLDTSKEGMHFAPVLRKKYAWQMVLAYDRHRIRSDSLECVKDTVTAPLATFTYDTTNTEPTSGACKDVCSVPEPTEKKPSASSFAVGDSVRAGKFMMVLTESRGTGAALSGKGLITIPMIHATLAVEFTNIKVNAAHQLYDGEIKGTHGPDAPLDPATANALGKDLGLTTKQIEAVHTVASSASRTVNALASGTPLMLPIGIDNEIGGERYVIGIIGVIFTSTNASMNAAMSYPLPDIGPNFGIGLGARDICFSPDGFGGNGNVTLYLASDIGYDHNGSWRFAFLAPKGEEKGCYVTFDCKGFKQLAIQAEVQFPRGWFRPFPTDDGTSKVKARFQTLVGRGGNFIATAELDRCELSSAPGWVFEAQDITIDHSTLENPKGLEFPTGYTGDQEKTWTGFYIGRASFSLPPDLRTFDSTAPPQISANNLIITRSGFSGSIRGENVFMYPKGNFGEWGGSIDTVGLDFLNTSLCRGWMTGRIKMPIAETPLRYLATLARPSTGDTTHKLVYQFVIRPESTLSADIWKARISLNPSSSISISNDNAYRKLVAIANLSGKITVAGDIGGIPKIDLPGVEFQDLKLQSVKPYFTNGTWSLASPEKSLAGFPLSISGIALANGTRNGKDLTGLSFKASINLSPGSNAISGSTSITLWGQLDLGSSGQKFSFYGAELDSISVNADLGPVVVAGSVGMFREDEIYGTGFRGTVRADILKRIGVTSTVQFGTVNGFRYFYVDAKGVFSPGIPFGTTGVGFYGLGGGFWWNMKRDGGGEPSIPASSGVAPPTAGATASGLRFVPSDGSFGFKAMVVLGTHPSPAAFNADLGLELDLQRTSTGVSLGRITLTGNGYMMAELTQREKAKVTCSANLSYDFPTSTLHGVFDARIDATPVTGTGQMVLHVAPQTWYMKIGEPSNRITLRLASWLTTNAYLMIGKDLPPPPPPPQRVLSILGMPSPNRNTNVAAGSGIALGASVSFSTGRQYYFIFYGDVSAGGGFDIALLKQTRCEGINGWQAQGQLYAYVDASVGLHVDIGFYTYYPCGPWWCAGLCRWCRNGYVGYRGDFEILGIHAAALLEVGGPSPLWVTGTVRGRYSILGGLVKGDCSFRFSKGTECRLL
jgi:hypothetical protein